MRYLYHLPAGARISCANQVGGDDSMSLHESHINHGAARKTETGSGLSRREVCKGLGLMGAALLLGGCESFPRLALPGLETDASANPALITPDRFAEKAGTVEAARANAAGGIEASNEFIRRFLLHSPRVHAASRPGGTIGSVLYNPKPATVASAVKLQMAGGKGEPALLHNDLGTMAATQYAQYGLRTFASIFPNVVSIVGDAIHRDRSLIQLVLTGNLPSERIVCTNQDMESLIGRQLTFASQMVHGVRCGTGMSSIQGTAIWTADPDAQRVPEGAISLALAGALIRLEVTGNEVRAITPTNPRVRPAGWQDVSEPYRNFAVGQLIEAYQAVADHPPRNAYEKAVVSTVLGEYAPYLDDIKKRLDWGHTCVKTYSDQKQDGRTDLLMQPVFAHSVRARKQL